MQVFYVIPTLGKKYRQRVTKDSKLVVGKLKAIQRAKEISKITKNRAKVVTYASPRKVVREYNNGEKVSQYKMLSYRGPFKHAESKANAPANVARVM